MPKKHAHKRKAKAKRKQPPMKLGQGLIKHTAKNLMDLGVFQVTMNAVREATKT